MTKPKMTVCKSCGAEIATSAKTCPKCGAKIKAPIYKRPWFIILIIFIVLYAIGSSGFNTGKKTTASPASNVPAASSVASSTVQEAATAAVEPQEDKADDNVPSEYKSALKKAETYSSMMHMSKIGIYNQLTSEYGEQFSEEAADYAVENLDADYEANALAKAETYSDTMYMSKAGIYNQLISEYGEQFTTEEAQYAVDHISADWNENALQKAKTYQSTMDMSHKAIYDQLTSEYGEQFTESEAQYAIDHLDD